MMVHKVSWHPGDLSEQYCTLCYKDGTEIQGKSAFFHQGFPIFLRTWDKMFLKEFSFVPAKLPKGVKNEKA